MTFSGQLYFWRSNFFTLFQSDYFDTTVTFSEQLFFQNSYFFLSFLRRVTFSQQLFFQNSFFFRAKILQNSHFLRIRSSLWQLLSAAAIFSLFRIKISKKELLFQIRYSINFFRKGILWKKLIFQRRNILYYPLFLESYLFEVATSSKDGTF